MANCPKCRKPSLVLLKSASGRKREDLLSCKSCNLAIFAEELKKKLFTI
ncbi:MAG: hypothetical protein OEW86_00170 [Nitrosopumilus sp.]|nr:hypothetical protein [Nitrosopumilus sp.]MDH5416386.1 hypothetical protein [Nitrosopumilus sp.]MDH5553709.1 hypothetical protein [Nitrosopumilus sp.]